MSDAQEAVDGTDSLDRGSGTKPIGKTICSEWNGFLGGMWNILELVNLSNHSLPIQLSIYDQTGQLSFTQSLDIGSGRQYDSLVHDMQARSQNAYGNVCITHAGNPGDLDGRMVYYKGNTPSQAGTGKDFQFAFAMPFSNGRTGRQAVAFNTFQPSYRPGDQSNPVANWLQLTNLGTSACGGSLKFYGLDGAELGNQRVNLNAGQRFDFAGHQFGKNLAGLVEWNPDCSGMPYELRDVRYLYDNAGMQDSFSTAFELEGSYGSGDALSVPLSRKGETSILEISNVLNSAINVTVNIYDEAGNLIAPFSFSLTAHASRHLILDTILASGSIGSASITSSAISSVVATAMQYGRRADGSIAYMYGLPAETGFGSVLRGSYNTYLGQDSELVVANSKSQAQTISILLTRSSGEIVQSAIPITVPAHGTRTLRINDYEVPDNYGVVTVQGQAANSIKAWLLRHKAADYVVPTPVRQ